MPHCRRRCRWTRRTRPTDNSMRWCVRNRCQVSGVGYQVAAILLATRFTLAASPSEIESTILLRDVTDQTSITFRHTDGGSGKYYIVEYMSAGLALFDYDSDGDVDIYFLNGAPMPGTKADVVPRDALYRNDGNWKFTDVTVQAGVGD